VRLIVGGERRDGVAREIVRSPYDGSPLAEVAVGGERDLDDAIGAVARAFGVTRALPTHRRVAVLDAVARRISAESETLARGIALESGKPIRFARAEVARAVVTFELASAEARALRGEVVPIDIEPRGDGRLCISTRVPRGAIAAFSPFNFPLNLVAHKLAPAVAVGASVVLKPPPQCPSTAFTLAEWILEAGYPAGALDLVHCAPEVAQRMVEDERIRVVSFTGSDAVGWRLKALAGRKHVLLELGGNAPCVVDETIEPADVVDPIATAAFASGGQVCIKAQRVLVHASRFDDFVARFTAAAGAMRCGDPLDEATVVGPLIEERHVVRVLDWIDEARRAGATVHCGGERQGWIVLPTVITGAPDDARVVREEIFGPVAVVEPFERFEDALERCNATRFGLQAGVFTRDVGRALQAHRELEYGGVIVNDVPAFRADSFPYGGTKDSGLGREGPRAAIEELTEPRVLVLRPAPGRPFDPPRPDVSDSRPRSGH
jgi:acyl-CoA reductase-like NAD-dependent aldehyde dehydrogenase